MSIINEIISNKVLLAAVSSWCAAQVIKFILILIRDKKVDLSILVAPGGMPSGHSATVMALSVGVGRMQGFDSALFAIALSMAFIIMYDAAGIRRAAGMQAAAINKIVERMKQGNIIKENRQITVNELREILGHTPMQVVVGAILGIVLAILICR
ncbi:MAG: divergent PAP2 family protein [Clostridiales bacterium]|nr:divergent PAP2 family protein [Clostridiales bacterium]MBQ2816898.1 divergent PAP2 family protein [Clostridia bacterium]